MKKICGMCLALTFLALPACTGTGHWLTLTLQGDVARRSPRDAIGSVVVCTTGDRRLQAEVASGRSFNSQSDLRVHFGLGRAAAIDAVEVRWANGEPARYAIRGSDRFVTIDQRRGVRP